MGTASSSEVHQPGPADQPQLELEVERRLEEYVGKSTSSSRAQSADGRFEMEVQGGGAPIHGEQSQCEGEEEEEEEDDGDGDTQSTSDCEANPATENAAGEAAVRATLAD